MNKQAAGRSAHAEHRWRRYAATAPRIVELLRWLKNNNRIIKQRMEQ